MSCIDIKDIPLRCSVYHGKGREGSTVFESKTQCMAFKAGVYQNASLTPRFVSLAWENRSTAGATDTSCRSTFLVSKLVYRVLPI